MTENLKRSLNTTPDSSRPSKIPKTQDHSDQEEEEEEEDKQQEESSMSKSSRVQRYLVAIEYIGTRFSGSQQQPNCRTVVGALEVVIVSVSLFSFTCKRHGNENRFWILRCYLIYPSFHFISLQG